MRPPTAKTTSTLRNSAGALAAAARQVSRPKLIAIVAGITIVIAAAMLINMTAAALAGIAIPLFLDRAGADPAVSSAVFVTAVTDIVGFLAFLGLATWWFAIR